MEEKHISSDHRHNHHHDHHKQQQAPSGTENHHAKQPHGVWVCHRCGWTYPNPHPSAKHRRNHRKHCGKIEGFTLIASGDRETQGGSSDEELTDDEHNPTDVWGNGNESTENFEPALWEKLLEKDVKEANQETYQELGNAGTSPVNPFIQEYRLSNKVEPQVFSIEGEHVQTSEQLNNGSTVERKHPSSTKGVEEDPLVSQVGWFASFPEVTNESHERKVDNESRTDASEMIPGALELPHTHLRNSPPRSSNPKPEEKKKGSIKSIWNLCVCCSGAS